MPRPCDENGGAIRDTPKCHARGRDTWSDADWTEHHAWIVEGYLTAYENDWGPIITQLAQRIGKSEQEALGLLLFQNVYALTRFTERIMPWLQGIDVSMRHAATMGQEANERSRRMYDIVKREMDDNEPWNQPKAGE